MRNTSTLSAVPDSSGCTDIPDVSGMSNREAALAYAAAGMYIVPTEPSKEHGKNPGKIVGNAWPSFSSVDPKVIDNWWDENENYGIALDCGKSGLYVIDVDSPDNIPAAWYEMLSGAPKHTTSTNSQTKGHYFFRQPQGRMLGASKNGLPKGWGDVRGWHGVVILPPTLHVGELGDKDKPHGHYEQSRLVPVPELPGWFLDLLKSDARMGDERPVTSAEFKRLTAEHAVASHPKLLKNAVARLKATIEDGGGRHDSMPEALCWAYREAMAGFYSMKDATEAMWQVFRECLVDEELGGRALGDGEWEGLVTWAAGLASAANPEETRAAVKARRQKQFDAATADGLYRLPAGVITDHEHAHEVIRWIGDRAKYAIDGAVWLMKDGESWTARPDLDAGGIVAMVADQMPQGEKLDEDLEEATAEQLDAHWEYENRLRYQDSTKAARIATRISKVVTSRLKDDSSIVRLSDLDRDPYVLHTPTGALDLLPDRPSDDKIDPLAVHLHCTRYPALDIETPAWWEFAEAVWPDEQVRAYALQLLAVGFTGISEKMFVYLYGERDKGKSSVPLLLADILGTYARSDIKATIVSNESMPWDKAALHGIRLGFVDEKPDWRGKATEELKTLTAGDAEISAAYKGKQPFKFSPTHTFVFASNHEPVLGDPAVRRRLRIVPCTGSSRAVRAARAKLGHIAGPVWRREAPGVLWQMVQLARKYSTNPDVVHEDAAPDRVKRIEARMHHDQDLFTEWVEEYTLRLSADQEWLTAKEVYDAFAEWCRKNPRGKYYLNDKNPQTLSMRLHHMSKVNGEIKSKPGRARTKRWNLDTNPARVKR